MNSRTLGNVEKSIGRAVFSTVITISRLSVMFIVSSTSRIHGGIGINMTARIAIRMSARYIWLRWPCVFCSRSSGSTLTHVGTRD